MPRNTKNIDGSKMGLTTSVLNKSISFSPANREGKTSAVRGLAAGAAGDPSLESEGDAAFVGVEGTLGGVEDARVAR